MNKDVTNSKNHNHEQDPKEAKCGSITSPLDLEFYLHALLRHEGPRPYSIHYPEDEETQEEEFTLEDLEAYRSRAGPEWPLGHYE